MSVDIKNGRVWWLYQARRVNVSGGAGVVLINVNIPTGEVAKLISASVVGPASATSILYVQVLDEDGALACNLAIIAAGASRSVNLPTIGTAPAHNNYANSVGLLIGPGQVLRVTSDVSILNETLTLGIALLLSQPTVPTWDIVGSVVGSALGASSISGPNTLQAVYLS